MTVQLVEHCADEKQVDQPNAELCEFPPMRESERVLPLAVRAVAEIQFRLETVLGRILRLDRCASVQLQPASLDRSFSL